MPCPDYSSVRLEKSVPPKKSHSWRSHIRTSAEEQSLNVTLQNKDSKPESGEPLNMGSSTAQPDSQNDNHQGFENVSPAAGPSEDMPLDFSLKPNSIRCVSESTPKSSQEKNSPVINFNGYPFGLCNGEQRFFGNRDFKPQALSEAKTRSSLDLYERMENTVSPQNDPNSCSLDMTKSEVSNDPDLGSSTGRGRYICHSPRLHSPSSSSPILAGMLASSPEMLPIMPMEVINSRLLTLGLQNGYPNGHSSACLPSGIPSPNSVMPSPAIFPPVGIMAPPALAFMPTPMNLLSPISPITSQSKVESKASRKVKQERPFKNYDVSFQDDLRWSLPFGPAGASSTLDSQQPVPRNVPQQNGSSHMSGSSNSQPDSDPPTASEMDNVPHSSVPNSSPEDTEDSSKASGRKRKAVADAEKDASYWERRKKNNQAAKRSRENRRIKEDTVAQQAIYFRGEATRLSQLMMHLNARVHDMSLKCASLEQDKLTLTAENAMIKQLVTQKRCGQCGNHLSDKLL